MNELIRGDYLPFNFTIEYDDGNVKEEIVDEAIFWLKSNKYSEKPLIEKKLSDKSIIFNKNNYCYNFHFDSNDTKDLDIDQEYSFAIKVFIDNKPYTVARGNMKFSWEGVFVYEVGNGDG